MRTSSRGGVTLIELLIVISIIAILSALIMGTASSAIENARQKNTQALVTKIFGLVNERLASYENRRVPLHLEYEDSINYSFKGQDRGRAVQDCRLLAARELQKYEMPDRWSDVANDPVMLSSVPQLAAQYRRLYQGDGTVATTNNQGAECLYAVVMFATGDGEARSLFREQEIGDTDGDQRKEFIDGWGRPISWQRWPAGWTKSTVQSGDANADHEPADHYRRDMPGTTGPAASAYQQNPATVPHLFSPANRLAPLLPTLRDDIGAYRLVPLIYSIGADGEQGFSTKDEAFKADLDPYTASENSVIPEDAGVLPGTITTDEATDTVHSHLNEY